MIQQNIAHILKEIETYSDHAKLVAVTKSVGIPEMDALLNAGIHRFGENRPQAFLEKYAHFKDYPEPIEWHYIGRLQTRPVTDMIDFVDYLHSLDRLRLADEIQKRATRPVKCFLQVNISGEDSKAGFQIDEIESVLDQLTSYDKIVVIGFMTMAPYDSDTESLRQIFRTLAEIRNTFRDKKMPHAPCTELSMGMSQDYPIALKEGATYIRVGTKLFE